MAATMIGRMAALTAFDQGVAVENLLVTAVTPSVVDYLPVSDEGAARVENDYRSAIETLRALPGVSASSYGDMPTADGRTLSLPTVEADGHVYRFPVLLIRAGPQYARTLGIRILSGRDLEAQDLGPAHRSAETPAVVGLRGAILSRSIADELWRGQDPIGRLFKVGNLQCAVVGISAPILPVLQQRFRSAPIIVGHQPVGWIGNTLPPLMTRMANARSDSNVVHHAVQSAFAGATEVQSSSFGDRLDRLVATERLGAAFFGWFGTGIALLALIGAHSVVSTSLVSRRSEMAIRTALGAPRRVLRWEACRPIAAAMAAGLLIGCFATAVGVRFLPFELSAMRPAFGPYLVSAAAVAAGAAIAVWVAVSRLTGHPDLRALANN
jgi:hypothetical protein